MLFPSPETIAAADLSQAGIGEARAATLRRLADAIVRRQFEFSAPTLDRAVSQLRSVCGVDESTANYIAMRAFGEPDAFPASAPREPLAEHSTVSYTHLDVYKRQIPSTASNSSGTECA